MEAETEARASSTLTPELDWIQDCPGTRVRSSSSGRSDVLASKSHGVGAAARTRGPGAALVVC